MKETINTIRVTFKADKETFEKLRNKVVAEQEAGTGFYGVYLDFNPDDQEGIVSTEETVPGGFDAVMSDLDDLLYEYNEEHLKGFWIAAEGGNIVRYDIEDGDVLGIGINWLAHYTVDQIMDISNYATRMFPDQEQDYSDSVE